MTTHGNGREPFANARSSQALWFATICVALLDSACTDTDRPLTPARTARNTAPTSVGSLSNARRRPEESAFFNLADGSPSSAGFFVDQKGTLVVYVRDSQHDESARTVVAGMLNFGGLKVPKGLSTPIEIRRAQFTFAQLAEWRDIVFDSVLTQMKGAVSLDVDEVVNRVAIGMSPPEFATLRAALPKQLASWGVDTSAVVYRREEPLKNTLSAPFRSRFFPGDLTTRTDTMIGGLGIGIEGGGGFSLGGCTMGFVADFNGQRGFVTASHCSSYEFYTDNSVAHQDNYGRRIGYESWDPAGYACGLGVVDQHVVHRT